MPCQAERYPTIFAKKATIHRLSEAEILCGIDANQDPNIGHLPSLLRHAHASLCFSRPKRSFLPSFGVVRSSFCSRTRPCPALVAILGLRRSFRFGFSSASAAFRSKDRLPWVPSNDCPTKHCDRCMCVTDVTLPNLEGPTQKELLLDTSKITQKLRCSIVQLLFRCHPPEHVQPSHPSSQLLPRSPGPSPADKECWKSPGR